MYSTVGSLTRPQRPPIPISATQIRGDTAVGETHKSQPVCSWKMLITALAKIFSHKDRQTFLHPAICALEWLHAKYNAWRRVAGKSHGSSLGSWMAAVCTWSGHDESSETPREQHHETAPQWIHAPQIRMYHPTWTAFCKSSLLPTFSSQAAHAPRSGRTPGESRTCRCGTSVDRPKQSPMARPGLCEPVDLERHVRWATVMSSTFWCLVTGSYFPMTSFEMMNKLVITKVYMSINYCQRFLSKLTMIK